MSSVNTAPCPPRSSGSLSCNVTTITAVLSAMTFSASGAAPTPLYSGVSEPLRPHAVYGDGHFRGLRVVPSPGAPHGGIAVGLHRTSARHPERFGDECGRHAHIHDGRLAGALVVARAVQGFATGFATTTLGATLRRLREASQINCSHRELDRYLWITGVYISWLDQKDANAELRGVLDNPSRSQIRLLNAFLPSTLERRFLTNDSTSFCSD